MTNELKFLSCTVNQHGLNEIREFLAANHVKGGDHFTDDMLHAWATQAEFQLSEGNLPTIELKARHSITGHAQEYQISWPGIDVRACAGNE